jgi:hypothetical protein
MTLGPGQALLRSARYFAGTRSKSDGAHRHSLNDRFQVVCVYSCNDCSWPAGAGNASTRGIHPERNFAVKQLCRRDDVTLLLAAA